jgi:hypothetical protein
MVTCPRLALRQRAPGKDEGMTDHKPLGVLALEGDWTDHMAENSTTRPLLQLLEEADYVKVIHRDVATLGEMAHYTSKWSDESYADYRLIYLAFHGTPGALELSERSVDLEELAVTLGPACRKRIVHFASCSVLNVPDEDLLRFKKQTGAAVVSGYGEDVEWLESCAFELLLISSLAMYARPGHAVRYVRQNYGELAGMLKWRAH